jgi:hypothetical protein
MERLKHHLGLAWIGMTWPIHLLFSWPIILLGLLHALTSQATHLLNRLRENSYELYHNDYEVYHPGYYATDSYHPGYYITEYYDPGVLVPAPEFFLQVLTYVEIINEGTTAILGFIGAYLIPYEYLCFASVLTIFWPFTVGLRQLVERHSGQASALDAACAAFHVARERLTQFVSWLQVAAQHFAARIEVITYTLPDYRELARYHRLEYQAGPLPIRCRELLVVRRIGGATAA